MRRVQAAMRVLIRPSATREQLQRAMLALEKLLQRPELEIAHRQKLSARAFCLKTRAGARLIWKPGEELARREEAAYRLDQQLGHLARVTPVVTRTLEGKTGSLRFYLEHARPAYRDVRSRYVLQNPERPNYYRIALLDCLIGNRDRHSGNWLLTDGGLVLPIDHGLAFPRSNHTRIHAYDFKHPVPFDPAWLQGLNLAALEPLIGAEALQAMQERLENLRSGHTYAWYASIATEPFDARDTFEIRFAEQTGLHHGIRVTNPDDYQTLKQHIEVHGYYTRSEDPARSWYAAVYLPTVQAGQRLHREFPQLSEGDLYLWMTYHRERMKGASDEEVAGYLADRFSGHPVKRVWKALRRGVQAAVSAALESPEPPRRTNRPGELAHK